MSNVSPLKHNAAPTADTSNPHMTTVPPSAQTFARLIPIGFLLLTQAGCGGGGTSTPAPATPAPTPIVLEASWSFDNLSGPTAPNAKSSYLSASLNSVKLVPGKVGTAIEFDPALSVSAVIVPLNDAKIDFSAAHLSAAMWIRPTTLDAGATYHLIGTNFSSNVQLVGGKVTLFLRPPTGSSETQDLIVQSVTSIAVGVWQHVAVTYDGLTARVYINGNLDASQSILHGIADLQNTAFYIGSMVPETGHKFAFPGAIDEAYFGAKVLSSADINGMAH
jgi:hypothetical protein